MFKGTMRRCCLATILTFDCPVTVTKPSPRMGNLSTDNESSISEGRINYGAQLPVARNMSPAIKIIRVSAEKLHYSRTISKPHREPHSQLRRLFTPPKHNNSQTTRDPTLLQFV